MKRWTWLEYRGERAHYVEDSWPGCILVEFIDGERQIWPRAECRVLGAAKASEPEQVTVSQSPQSTIDQ